MTNCAFQSITIISPNAVLLLGIGSSHGSPASTMSRLQLDSRKLSQLYITVWIRPHQEAGGVVVQQLPAAQACQTVVTLHLWVIAAHLLHLDLQKCDPGSPAGETDNIPRSMNIQRMKEQSQFSILRYNSRCSRTMTESD